MSREEDALAYLYGFNGVQQIEGSILYLFYTDRERYEPGEQVRMTLLKVNTGYNEKVFTYSTSQYYDFIINGKEGLVWQWSKGKYFLQVIQQKLLRSGEMMVVQEVWDIPRELAPGKYLVQTKNLTHPQVKLQLVILVTPDGSGG